MLMRENGVEATSVSDIMTAAGLTHGGFYRHFSSKEDLAASAFKYAVDGIVRDWESAATIEDRTRAREDYLATYLSSDHLAKSGQGCPLAALGAEAAREDGSLHDAAADAVRRMIGLLSSPDDASSERDSGRAAATMALLVGTLTIARALDDSKQARMALEAGKKGLSALWDAWPAAKNRSRARK